MDGDDVRIAVVLEELAELGRRIGERAGELARLTMERQRTASEPADARVARVAAATIDLATDLTSGAAAVVASREPSGCHPSGRKPSGQATKRRRSRREPPTSSRQASDGHDTDQSIDHHTTLDHDTQNPRSDRVAGRRRSRRQTLGRLVPRGAGRTTPRKRTLGPVFASALVHLVALFSMAAVYVVVEAKPIRLALTVGDAAEPAFEEATLIAIESPEAPTEPVELLADVEPTDIDPTDIDPTDVEPMDAEPLSLLEPALPDAQPAERDPVREAAGAEAALDPAAMFTEIGGQGDAKPAGGGKGGGAGRPAAPFFGRAGQGRSVCFICDNSNSHRDGSFHAVLEELARAVEVLKPEQSFFVIFASDAAYPLFHPAAVEGLQPATAANKQKLRAWLGTVEMCRGGKGIDEAVKLASGLGAEVVYLLSDGELGASVVDRIEGADFGGAVVHTFGMQQTVIDRRTGQLNLDKLREQQGHDRNLALIATAHGGTFTPVIVPPPAAALERLRPIPRNRSRGAVWGLKL